MIFPWIVLRVAGLPLRDDECLRPQRILAHNAEVSALEDAIATDRSELDQLLFLYVREHYAHETRKAALALKRDIQAGRATDRSAANIDALRPHIPAPAAARLMEWAGQVQQLSSLYMRDEDLGATMRGPALQAITGLMDDPWFSRGLDEAAAALSARVKRGGFRPSQKDLSTLLSYASRTIWKTSPFSTFMFSGHFHLNHGGSPGLDIRGDQLLATPRRELDADFKAKRPAPALSRIALHARSRVDGTGVTFVRSSYQPSNAGYWRHDQLLRMNLEPRLASALADLRVPLPWSTASRRLATAAGDHAGDRLVEAFTRAGVLEACPAEDDGRVAGSRPSEPGVDRPKAAPQPPGSFGALRGTEELGDARLCKVVTAAVQASGRFLVESPYYEQLKTRFCQLFPDGVCTDVSAFAFDAARSFHLPAQGSSTPRAVSPSRPTALTIFLQLQDTKGSLVGVVNQAHAVVAGQSLKMLSGAPSDAAVVTAYATWLQQCYSGAEPVELPVCRECNVLQRQPSITTRRLSWGGEVVEKERRLDIDDLQLRYDTNTGTFILRDRDGAKVALAYLGAVVPGPNWGAAYAIYLLCNPFVCRLPPPPAYEPSIGGVQSYGEIMIGDTVVRRPGWNVPSNLLLDAMDANPVRTARNLSRLSAAAGLPMQAFLSNVSRQPTSPSQANLRKPMYVHFDNPLFADLIHRIAQRTPLLKVECALPAADAQWLQLDGTPRISEIIVEGLVAAQQRGPATASHPGGEDVAK
jgi:hypothetical protein